MIDFAIASHTLLNLFVGALYSVSFLWGSHELRMMNDDDDGIISHHLLI